MVGARLGAYEITAKVGAGGMGEVYRATDTNLDREVAIKVLPAEVAGDPDRLARFEREAKLLAALNHSGIAARLRLRAGRAPRRIGPALPGDGARRGRGPRASA